MNNNQLPLVTYPQAVRLKTAGFDWLCNAYYSETGKLNETGARNNFNNKVAHFTNAPTVALALEWFREVKEIQCGTMPKRIFDLVWYAWWYSIDGNMTATSDGVSKHKECASMLLDKLLELIENGN